MTIELDKRIKNQHCIFTIFDKECAKPYIGKQGYFTNSYSSFSNLKNCAKGELTAIADDSISDSYCSGKYFYDFFIPEDYLKPEKKEFRPYKSPVELPFTVGDIIFLRNKSDQCIDKCICTSIALSSNSNNIELISFGRIGYDPKNLFDFKEWKFAKDIYGEYKPCGVEE